MDRNGDDTGVNLALGVALRKESVDRNLVVGLLCTFTSLSLSARRAWIEIFRPSPQVKPVRVALRKESVDRNCDLEPIRNTEAVALRKESVDRNGLLQVCWSILLCRSPQGERG